MLDFVEFDWQSAYSVFTIGVGAIHKGRPQNFGYFRPFPPPCPQTSAT